MGDSILKISRLQGSSNWELWAIRMEAVLTEKGYYNVMIPATEPIAEADLILRNDRAKRALAYIRLALSDGPLLQTRNIIDPCILWNTLKTLYEPKGFSSEFLLCKQLFETTLAKTGNSIENYINRIKRLTDDLSARNIEIPTKVIAAWTLNNLTPEFESTVAMISQQFRNSQSEIVLDNLFAHLIDESRRLKSKEPDEMALTSQKSEYRNNQKSDANKSNKKCKYCKKSGHFESDCWKKYPDLTPDWAKVKTGAKPNTGNNATEKDEITLISQNHAMISTNQNEWILDSAATSHICAERTMFSTLEPCTTMLNWGNANQIKTSGIGTIKIRFTSTNQTVILTDCLFVPELGVNLLSLGTLSQKGASVHFNTSEIKISLGPKTVALGNNQNRLSVFKAVALKESVLLSAEAKTWHQRLGHISTSIMRKLPKSVEGCIFHQNGEEFDSTKCEICIKAKMTKHISRTPSTPHYTYLELVHSDICGPISPATHQDFRYFVTFTDSFTKYARVRLLHTKDDVIEAIKNFTLAQNKRTNGIQRFHQDNAQELKNKETYAFFNKKGVKYTYSAPYSPEQNGSAERINRTLLNKVRAMMFDSPLSEEKELWGEALMAACYLYNRTPHSAIDMTPYQAWHRTKPDLANIKKWGSVAYLKVAQTKKLDEKAIKKYLIGYGSNQFKLLDPETNEVTWARDITVLENQESPETRPKTAKIVEIEEENPDTEFEPDPNRNLIDQLT